MCGGGGRGEADLYEVTLVSLKKLKSSVDCLFQVFGSAKADILTWLLYRFTGE